MRHRNSLTLAVIAALVIVLIPLPALAGEKDKEAHKCTASTQECLNKMVQSMKTRGWIGIEMDEVKGTKTVVIKRVVPGSPAEAAGFQVGDVLVAVEGKRFADNTETECVTCAVMKENWVPGRKVTYLVSRNGSEVTVAPTLASVPPDVLAQWVGSHMIEHAQVEIAKK